MVKILVICLTIMLLPINVAAEVTEGYVRQYLRDAITAQEIYFATNDKYASCGNTGACSKTLPRLRDESARIILTMSARTSESGSEQHKQHENNSFTATATSATDKSINFSYDSTTGVITPQ